MLDFQEVKANHPIEDVAERLGLKLKKEGQTYRGPCWSGEGGDRALCITPSKGVFYSFAQQVGGDCIKLVACVLEMTAKEAAQWIAGDTVPEKSKKVEKPSGGFKPLDYLQPDHPAVEALGLDTLDMAKIGGGYAPRGVLRGTVAFPVRDETGKLLGYLGVTDAKTPSQWHF